MKRHILVTSCLPLVLAVSACTTPPHDYSAYLEQIPRSILVLPPLNESPEVLAPYSFLSTVSRPLAEHGYYVFPVAMVDAFLKENGMPTPGEMHQIPLNRLGEEFGADAVLYVVIKQYGTEYQVLNSATKVFAACRLVDVDTGTVIWAGRAAAARDSSSGQNNIAGMLANALVSQVVNTTSDQAHALCHQANAGMVRNGHHGFLRGPRSPRQEEDLTRRRQDQLKLLENQP